MSAEVKYQFQLRLTNGEVNDQFNSEGLLTADQSASAMVKGTLDVTPGAAGVAIPLGSVSTPGWAGFVNSDDEDKYDPAPNTDYLLVGIQIAGTFHEFAKLEVGEKFICRLGTTAPYARPIIAGSAVSLPLFYVIYED